MSPSRAAEAESGSLKRTSTQGLPPWTMRVSTTLNTPEAGTVTCRGST